MRQIHFGLMVIFATISFLMIKDGTNILTPKPTGFEIKLNDTQQWFIGHTGKYIQKIKNETGAFPSTDHVEKILNAKENTAYKFLGIKYILNGYPAVLKEVYGHPPDDGYVLEFSAEYKKTYYISWAGDSKKAYVVIEENYYRFLLSLVVGLISLIIASFHMVKILRNE